MKGRIAGFSATILCTGVALFTCLLVVPVSAGANPIPVFGTGLNSSGALLSVGATDPNYTITSSPCGATSAITEAPFGGVYAPNTSTSQWITSPCQDDAGVFVYQTTFSLAGLNSSTAQLSGSWTSDNESTIYLNGVSTGNAIGSDSFGSLTSFTITSGFVSGLNTLDIDVTNDYYSPSGLQLEMTGTASPSSVSPVPEPSMLLLFGTGLLGFGPLVRRQLKRA